MSQPTFVQKIGAKNANASSLVLTPGASVTAGNTILVGIILNANGTQTPGGVAGIVDSAGDIMSGMVDTGVPINKWSSLGVASQNGIRMEWWVCKGAAAITDLTISLTFANSINAVMLEYSKGNGITRPIFQALQPNQNTIASHYIKETVSTFPNSGAEVMIGLFAMLSDTFNSTPIEGTARATDALNIPPDLSYQVLQNGTVDLTGLLNLTAVSSSQLASPTNVANSSMQCFYLLISGGLILNTPPGFSDQLDSNLAAEKFALGIQLAKINGNSGLGMCRMEFFQGVYTNGQTVDLPVSSVDGYSYSREELLYVWSVYSSCNPGNGWITGPQALWYAQWKVDQVTGIVTTEEFYRADGQAASSNDGYLQVFTIAQRQRVALTVAELPTWTELLPESFKSDLPYSEDLLVALNNNSKFAVVGQECIYMGEFKNGDTVPTPVSPADSFAYIYGEVKFVFSWRWTTGSSAYVQLACPPLYTLASLNAAVSSSGVVTCAVGMMGQGGESYANHTTMGRIAVFALCQRLPRYEIFLSSKPWTNQGGLNPSFPVDDIWDSTTNVAIPVTAGITYTLSYLSGTVPTSGSPVTPAGTLNPAVISYGSFVPGATTFQGLGCFADDDGNIVGSPFKFGIAPFNLTVPSTATRIQLGNAYASPVGTYTGDDSNFWTLNITRYSTTTAKNFAEISDSVFYPGNELPAAIGLQVFQNIQEGSLSPEFFGPTLYGPGDTIPVPTSAIDGYVYTRDELTYIWEWAEMTPGPWPPSSGSHNRCSLFSASINQSSGVVSDVIWRLEPGGPYQEETTNGRISVVVVGFRSSQQSSVTTPATINTAPSDAGSAITDSNPVSVNGV